MGNINDSDIDMLVAIALNAKDVIHPLRDIERKNFLLFLENVKLRKQLEYVAKREMQRDMAAQHAVFVCKQQEDDIMHVCMEIKRCLSEKGMRYDLEDLNRNSSTPDEFLAWVQRYFKNAAANSRKIFGLTPVDTFPEVVRNICTNLYRQRGDEERAAFWCDLPDSMVLGEFTFLLEGLFDANKTLKETFCARIKEHRKKNRELLLAMYNIMASFEV